MYRITTTVLAILAAAPTHLSPSNERKAGEVHAAGVQAPNLPGYCGVYALYRGALALGKCPHFGELLKPAYISKAANGSSAEQLTLAASSIGLECIHITHLNSSALKRVDTPTLLHVKSKLGSNAYDHWVLFLGVEQSKARVCDGIQEVQLTDFRDLSAGWDGHALILNPAPGLRRAIILAAFTPYLGICAASLAVMIALRWSWIYLVAGWLTKRRVLGVDYALQALAVAGAGFMVAGALHALGFLAGPPLIAAIQEEKLGTFLPIVSTHDMDRIISRREMIIVDARLQQDFDAGHIEDAVNIQRSATLEECSAALGPVSKDTPIVLYCQSNGCPYSVDVARSLIKCGFHNLYLFSGGWLEWQSRKS